MARCIAPSSHLQPDPGGVDGDVGVTVHTFGYVSKKTKKSGGKATEAKALSAIDIYWLQLRRNTRIYLFLPGTSRR